jgi:hypothetical protein
MATAAGFPLENARSKTGANAASFNALRPPVPIMPCNRTTLTEVVFFKKGKRNFMARM